MPGRIVAAWRIDTTPPRRVEIPEHWLGHPTLGKAYSAELPTAEPGSPEGTSDGQPAGDSPTTESTSTEDPSGEAPTGDSPPDQVDETPATPARKGSKPRGSGDKED